MLAEACAWLNRQPVQYVKICSLYGVGFYYIPGTDMCIKIGGWVRAEYAYGDNGNFAWGWANGNFNNRTTNNSTWRARGYITADARSQTEYGTVRGYLAVGLSTNNVGFDGAGNTFSANRAFIQWAGFTFGLAQSFFDFYSSPATSYWGSFPASDTGDGGWMVGGYTAQFGNGLSATLAAEMRRTTQIVQEVPPAAQGTINPGAFPGSGGAYGGFQAPDIVGNLRIDQAWGSAQIMGALHQVNATYYIGTGTTPASLGSGHPDDKLGFAIGAGIKLNAPMIGQGDFLQVQVNYTEGALRYIFQTPNSNWGKMDGVSAGWGVLTDAVYGGTIAAGTASELSLATAWNVNAAYDHFWNARWRTSLYGGYAAVSYDALGQSELCGFGQAPVANGCDMNWQVWWLGSRTQWNVTKDFYLGLDVLYSKLQTALLSNTTAPLAVATNGLGVPATDVDNWQFRFRVHRDFYP
ncbi:MAG TPA: porin [Pseudolabrys sp.]|nr:porin [Pseudolabrys sp.]